MHGFVKVEVPVWTSRKEALVARQRNECRKPRNINCANSRCHWFIICTIPVRIRSLPPGAIRCPGRLQGMQLLLISQDNPLLTACQTFPAVLPPILRGLIRSNMLRKSLEAAHLDLLTTDRIILSAFRP